MDLSERPRVVMVVRLFAPWVGGMERQAQKLASTMNSLAIAETRIVTGRWFPGTKRREWLEGVRVDRTAALRAERGVRGWRKPGALVFMLSLFVHLVRTRHTFDLIHVHGLSYHTAVCRLVSRVTGAPMLVKLANSGEASDIAKMRRGQHFPGTRWVLPFALGGERYVALNAAIRAELEAAGVDPGRVIEIPNGVELAAAPRRPPPAGVLRLLFVGRLHRQKSLDTVLTAMAELGELSVPVVLDVVGDGPDRSRLEDLARATSRAGSVRFHGASDTVEAFLREADALVLPSRSEGLSNALLEAMALGVPGIVSDIPGNLAVVTDGRTGFVFRTGDAEDLAVLLRRVASNRELLRAAGGAAYEVAAREFALGSIAAQYRMVYDTMLASAGRQRRRG